MDVPRARTLSAPTWLNARTVLGLIIFCSSVLGGQYLIRASATTVSMWATTEDLPQGSVLGPEHLRPVEVRLPGDLQARYVPADEQITGSILGKAVLEGELVPRSWIGEKTDTSPGRAMTVPVTPEHAVGGELRAGDRVDIFATFDPGDVRARTTLLARDIEILNVVTAGGFALDEEAAVGITVAVSPDEAVRLAFAIRTGEIDVVRILGAADEPTVTTVRAGDFP